MSHATRAAFVDRDGVINGLAPDPETGLPESPIRVSDVSLLPNAAESLRQLADNGFSLVCVTNQPAAAKGKTSLEELQRIQLRIEELLTAQGAHFDLVETCYHHPEGVIAELSGRCDCRKPAPGMLRRAAEVLGIDLTVSWMIGDSDTDIEAGKQAGCRTALILHPLSAHRRSSEIEPTLVADDLLGAVRLILREQAHC